MSANISFLICFFLIAFAVLDTSTAKKDEKKKLPVVKVYELKSGNISIKVTNWGATIMSVILPDKTGKLADVVLGFDSADEYKNDTSYFGALVGRVINRIGGAKFTLNGTTYHLVANEGNNTLHGGKIGFSDVIWSVRRHKREGKAPFITFTYLSPDGDQGFPGTLAVSVTYLLVDQQLHVTMKAKALNKPTPVNLGQHTYWNLGGHNSGNILSNTVQISSSQITLLDDSAIPTGQIAPVKGTPYDFLKPHTVQSRINQLPQGYNINYVIDGHTGTKVKKIAMVHEKKSGRLMELWTNAPAVQFYTAYYLSNTTGKGGYVYGSYGGLCLETQGFPDAVNHPNFPSVIVNPGKPYRHVMLFKFSTK